MANYIRLDKVAEKINLVNLTPEIDLHEVKIVKQNMNRPAFQLTGYYEYFDRERLQVMGMAEFKYLETLPEKCRNERIRNFLACGMPAIVCARNLRPDSYFLNCAKENRIPILSTDEVTANVIVKLTSFINTALAPRDTLHGVFVDVYGEGILITGESGIGKSETAVELIKRGHRLIADDLVEFYRIEDMIMGRAPHMTRHFVELRGIGVVDVKSLYGVESVKERSQLDMVIALQEWTGSNHYDRLGLNEEFQEILGVNVVKHTVPIRPGRNLAIIIETAAVNNRQKKMGYNAAKALCEKVSAEIHEKNMRREQGLPIDEDDE